MEIFYGFEPRVWHLVLTILILMLILIPAAIGDYQHQKIPNILSMPGWIIGPVLAALLLGVEGAVNSLLGLLFMLGIMFPLWRIHWFGAADVKLLASVGALVGFADAPMILLGVMVVGMVLSLLVLAYERRLGHFVMALLYGQLFKSTVESERQGTGETGIPYAIPIAFGTMLTLLYRQL